LNLGTMVGGTIEDYGNGWYRVTGIATTTRPFQIIAYPNSSYTSHTTSGDYFIWGVQSELSATYPTSYIPTLGTAVTRVADSASKSGISSLINSEEGVLYVEMAALADDGTTKVICLNSGSFNNRIQINSTAISNQIQGYAQSNGTIYFNAVTILSDITSLNKIAVKWKVNDFALWINGVEVATDASGQTPIGLSVLDFNIVNAAPFFGNVQSVMVFPSALSDTDLAALTTL